jgi:Spy/CpxP family protein refolding chaperone
MKKGIITLMAVALLLPLTVLAQPGPGNGSACPQGRGMGMGDGPFCPQGRADMGQGGRGFGRRGGDGFGLGAIMMMADELALTDAQRDQLKKMQTDFKLQMIDKDAAAEKAEVQLRALMMDKNASEVEVGKSIDAVARLRADVQKARFSHHKQMLGVLTAEQTTKLEQLRKTRMEEGPAGRHGMRRGQDKDDLEGEGEDQG